METQEQAQIVLGTLLSRPLMANAPNSGVTVANVLARYMANAELDRSTRKTYDGYIRRTILPALGSMKLRKVRGLLSPAAPCGR